MVLVSLSRQLRLVTALHIRFTKCGWGIHSRTANTEELLHKFPQYNNILAGLIAIDYKDQSTLHYGLGTSCCPLHRKIQRLLNKISRSINSICWLTLLLLHFITNPVLRVFSLVEWELFVVLGPTDESISFFDLAVNTSEEGMKWGVQVNS